METIITATSTKIDLNILFQTFPRKGMETREPALGAVQKAFSNFSPQGDGNALVGQLDQQPKLLGFFKLFPARGWKPIYPLPVSRLGE